MESVYTIEFIRVTERRSGMTVSPWRAMTVRIIQKKQFMVKETERMGRKFERN